MSVTSLGYLGFRARDIEAWSRFGTDILGLMKATPQNGELRFRADAQSWRIWIEEGPEDDVAVLGFEVSGPDEFHALKTRLAENGVEVGNDGSEMAKRRGVTELFSCRDPHGLRNEIYYGATEQHEAPFVSPTGVSFVTGEQGIGHAVLTTPDIAASRKFYSNILGFRLSDTIRLKLAPHMAVEMEFYHCNPRHHTLALIPVPAPKKLHHFMLQTATLDNVGFALDRATAAGCPITASLGRHTNDHMVSFYARTPSGFEVEYGFGARTVDDMSWRVARHDAPSIWGHKRLQH